MEKQIVIDIVIPVYNTSQYLDECLESIHNQTFKDWRGLIIEDKSTDNSLEICQKWAQKDPRFEIIALPENKGLSNVRNVGLQHVSAPYFTSIDSDDYIGPKHLEAIYETIKATNADMIMTGYTCVYKDGISSKPTEIYRTNQTIKNPELFDLMTREIIASAVWKYTFNTQKFKEGKLKFWENRYFEDFEIALQIPHFFNELVHTGTADYYYRINPQGIIYTTKNNPFKVYNHVLALLRRWDILDETTLISDYTKNALKTWVLKSIILDYNKYLKNIPASTEKEEYLKIMQDEIKKRGIKLVTKNIFFYKLYLSLKKRYYEKALKKRFLRNKN